MLQEKQQPQQKGDRLRFTKSWGEGGGSLHEGGLGQVLNPPSMLPAAQVVLQIGLAGGCNPTCWAEKLHLQHSLSSQHHESP